MSKGHNVFTVEYTKAADDAVYSVDIDQTDIDERVKTLQAATGQTASSADLKNILVRLINEVRAGKSKLSPAFDYGTLVNVDLEAQTETPDVEPLAASPKKAASVSLVTVESPVTIEASTAKIGFLETFSAFLKTLHTKLTQWMKR